MAAALLVLALSLAGAASAWIQDDQAAPSWVFALDGPTGGNDTATDVVMTSKATWVVGLAWNAGDLDVSLARIPRNSAALPQLHLWDSPNSSNDANYDVAVKGSYVYTSGASRNSAGNLDLLVMRWTSNAAVRWAKRYNGVAKQDDAATDVAVDAAGNVLVCGTSDGAHNEDWVVLKYSPAGKKLWTWKYDGPPHGADQPEELLVDAGGNVYVTGTSVEAELLTAAYTVKLSPGGKKLWAKKYTGPENKITNARALARCPSGGVYVGGSTFVAGDFDMCLVRYSANGARKVWERFDVPANGDQWLNDIVVTSDGRIVGVGEVGSAPATTPTGVVWNGAGTRDAYMNRKHARPRLLGRRLRRRHPRVLHDGAMGRDDVRAHRSSEYQPAWHDLAL